MGIQKLDSQSIINKLSYYKNEVKDFLSAIKDRIKSIINTCVNFNSDNFKMNNNNSIKIIKNNIILIGENKGNNNDVLIENISLQDNKPKNLRFSYAPQITEIYPLDSSFESLKSLDSFGSLDSLHSFQYNEDCINVEENENSRMRKIIEITFEKGIESRCNDISKDDSLNLKNRFLSFINDDYFFINQWRKALLETKEGEFNEELFNLIIYSFEIKTLNNAKELYDSYTNSEIKDRILKEEDLNEENKLIRLLWTKKIIITKTMKENEIYKDLVEKYKIIQQK